MMMWNGGSELAAAEVLAQQDEALTPLMWTAGRERLAVALETTARKVEVVMGYLDPTAQGGVLTIARRGG